LLQSAASGELGGSFGLGRSSTDHDLLQHAAGRRSGALMSQSSGLTVSCSTVSAAAGGSAILLDTKIADIGLFGRHNFGSFHGPRHCGAVRGAAQRGRFDLPGPYPGRDRIYFFGGPWVSTFSATDFADSTLGVNVNAAASRPRRRSRCSMLRDRGPGPGPWRSTRIASFPGLPSPALARSPANRDVRSRILQSGSLRGRQRFQFGSADGLERQQRGSADSPCRTRAAASMP